MSQRVYAVLFHVPENQLGTVLDVLKKSVTLVSVTPTEEVKNDIPSHTKKHTGYVGGKRNKGISGADLLMETMTEPRIYTLDELTKVFINRGFAWNSVSPNLSRLVHDGTLKQVGPGKYAKTGVNIKI